jgi:hypothetical protein
VIVDVDAIVFDTLIVAALVNRNDTVDMVDGP